MRCGECVGSIAPLQRSRPNSVIRENNPVLLLSLFVLPAMQCFVGSQVYYPPPPPPLRFRYFQIPRPCANPPPHGGGVDPSVLDANYPPN